MGNYLVCIYISYLSGAVIKQHAQMQLKGDRGSFYLIVQRDMILGKEAIP